MKLSDEVKIRFNEKFKRGSTPWVRGGDMPFIRKFAGLVLSKQDTPKLFDIGCGDGWATFYFGTRGI
jgi:hypothetical protein